MVDVPVTKEVLVWARNFRGLNLQDAADKLGLPLDKLAALESGQSTPGMALFERICSTYQLSQSTMFRRSPPKVPPLPKDFRTLAGQPPDFSFEFHIALSNVRSLQHTLRNLSREDPDFPIARLPQYSRRDDPWEQGERERRRLGVTTEDQLSWSSGDGFRRWRAILESQGIGVFLQKFPLDDCRGFSLLTRGFPPCIVVNKAEEYERARSFTLVHEYAHLLIGEPGVSDLGFRNPTEAFCNKFAAAFLMPMEALKAVLPSWPNEPVDWDVGVIRYCSSRLKVSQRALALRLQECGLAPADFYARFGWGGGAAKRRQEPGGSYIRTRLSEVGSHFAGAVMGAIDRYAIDTVTGAQALNIRPEHFPKVREYIERQRERAIAG